MLRMKRIFNIYNRIHDFGSTKIAGFETLNLTTFKFRNYMCAKFLH